jgi:hypothetical protein
VRLPAARLHVKWTVKGRVAHLPYTRCTAIAIDRSRASQSTRFPAAFVVYRTAASRLVRADRRARTNYQQTYVADPLAQDASIGSDSRQCCRRHAISRRSRPLVVIGIMRPTFLCTVAGHTHWPRGVVVGKNCSAEMPCKTSLLERKYTKFLYVQRYVSNNGRL